MSAASCKRLQKRCKRLQRHQRERERERGLEIAGREPGRGVSVTIREVAREAEVSVATVSRVLNGKGPVHQETERRIRRVAERLRYVPHPVARSLITRRTHTIGVLLPDLYGEFFSEVIRGIDLSARRSGYHVVVSSSHSDRAETEAMIRAMRGRVDGLIVLSPDERTPSLKTDLPERFPVILLNSPARRSLDSLNIDNFGGAVAMVRHLVALGHRRIAFIRGPDRNRDAAERLRGYREAVRASSVDVSESLEIPGDFRESAGYDACRRILKIEQRPTAIFAANDSMAIGMLYGFRELGIPVPERFAVVGFDDIPIARYITPPLTSVRVPIATLGERATLRVLQAIEEGTSHRSRQETLPTVLVVRASCGSPPRKVGNGAPPADRKSSSGNPLAD
jgi:LacI family transcriptional regulator